VITLQEGAIEYRFGEGWRASAYDRWSFFLRHFQSSCGGNKGVDFVAHDTNDTLWLIELKDFRAHPRTKPIELPEEVAVKVRDSMAGIFAAAKWHSDHEHLEDARKHLSAKKVRVVLHLEQPETHSKLFPRVFKLADVQQKLKQLIRAIDAHPRVVEALSLEGMPWRDVTIST
jgi:hypothetical protein